MTTFVAAFAQDSVSTFVNSRNFKLTSTITGYPALDSRTDEPKMVSGTNESFTVTAAITPRTNDSGLPQWTGSYISSLTVELGGVSVFTDDFTDESCTSKTITVKWDTTHFTHNTTKDIKVTAKMKVWRGIKIPPSETWIYWDPVGGPPYEVSAPETSVSVCIYNIGGACELADRGSNTVISSVESAYGTMNHGIEVDGINMIQASCDSQDVTNSVSFSTAFYFGGHGVCNKNIPQGVSNFGEQIGWGYSNSDIETIRYYVTALALPPINFAFVDACSTGYNNNMATAFLYPCPNIYTAPHYTVDRAEMGWRYDKYPQWSKVFTPVFYQQLAQEATVKDARETAWAALITAIENEEVPDFDYEDQNEMLELISIWGDQQTRLHGLYNGEDEEAPAYWYEVTE